MYIDRERNFVLLSMPRTGSTTAREVCARLGNGRRFQVPHATSTEWRGILLEYHEKGWIDWPEDEVMRIIATAKIYCTNRADEAAWLRSVYHHGMTYPKGREYLRAWCDGEPDLAVFMREAFTTRGGLPDLPYEPMLNPWPDSPYLSLYLTMRAHMAAMADGWVWLDSQARDLAQLLGVSQEAVLKVGRHNQPRTQR